MRCAHVQHPRSCWRILLLLEFRIERLLNLAHQRHFLLSCYMSDGLPSSLELLTPTGMCCVCLDCSDLSRIVECYKRRLTLPPSSLLLLFLSVKTFITNRSIPRLMNTILVLDAPGRRYRFLNCLFRPPRAVLQRACSRWKELGRVCAGLSKSSQPLDSSWVWSCRVPARIAGAG